MTDMRVISGMYKGRKIQAAPGKRTRPTTDRVREAWASTLTSLMPEGSFEGICVLDAFAGSGALGLELLSRGAGECLFIERDRAAYAILAENIASLGIPGSQARTCMADSLSPQLLSCMKGHVPFDIVVLDPPYDTGIDKVKSLLSTLGRAGLLVSKGLVTYEHAAGYAHSLEGFLLCRACTPAALHLARTKVYGSTSIDYYVCT